MHDLDPFRRSVQSALAALQRHVACCSDGRYDATPPRALQRIRQMHLDALVDALAALADAERRHYHPETRHAV